MARRLVLTILHKITNPAVLAFWFQGWLCNTVGAVLQDISLHPDWHTHYNLSGNSLLDIYAAFASADMSFRVPLIVNGTQQFFSLSSLMQLDMPSLYRQSVAGLARVADHASQNPDSPAGQLFTKGSCQSLAVAVCVLEMPHHSAKLCDEHLMKDSSMRQGQVTGVDIMHRLESQVRQVFL